MTKVKTTERGWAAHYIRAQDCLYHRNTLIEYKNKKVIVSSVGKMLNRRERKYEEIAGSDFGMETLVFKAKKIICKQTKEIYYEADVSKQIFLDDEKYIRIKDMTDAKMDAQHEKFVKIMKRRIRNAKN